MRITVLGQHQAWRDEPGIERFILREVEGFRQTIQGLRAQGATDATDEELDKRSKELPQEIAEALDGVTVFEIEVNGNSSLFEAHRFWDKNSECQAMEQTYLNASGTEVISEEPNLPPDIASFRVVISMHDWPAYGELVGPTGLLSTPPVTPMPERLWKFVPYTLLD